MSNSHLQAIESYVKLLNANASTHAFRAAVELDIFDCLETGQKTAAQIADACGLQAEPVEWLLDALCLLGVVERYDDDFAMAQVVQLLPMDFRDLGDRYWQHLADYLRTGQSVVDEADFHVEARSMQWMMTPAAMELIRVLDIGNSRKALRVLEFSCGVAVCSLSLAYADSDSIVDVIDQEPALQATREHAQAIGVSDRLETIAGDYQNVDLPDTKYDLVVLTDLTHMDQIEQNLRLVQRIRDVLKPNGEIAIVDRFPGQEEGELPHRLFRLNAGLRTPSGRVHTPHELQEMLIEAGFAKPQFVHLAVPPFTMGLLLASRE